MKRGAIFDMDGTLFDTEKYYRKAWFEAAPEFGEEPNVTFTEAVSGTSSGEEFARIINSFYPNIDAPAYLARVIELVHDWSEENLIVMEGVEKILSFLKSAGVKCAVASSSPTELIERNLRRTNLRGYFDEIVGGDQVSNGKPAPDIFLLAAERINIAPNDCYVFEDSRNGILAANAANCTPLLIVDQYKPDNDIKKICTVFQNMTEALSALQGGRL